MIGAHVHQRQLIVLTAAALLLVACAPDDDEQEVAQAPGTLFEGDEERDTDPDVDADNFDEFTADNRDFAFSIFDEIRDEKGEDENVFLSPHSISTALAMTYEGAAENTRDEMAEALRFHVGDDVLHPAFNKLDLELDARTDIDTDDGEDLELEIVNQTWGQEDYPFLDPYLNVLSKHYGAGMYAVDFRAEFEQIREDINAWVEDRTEGHIEDLLPDGSLDSLTRLVLVNAIYFYGTWQDTFDDGRTSDEPFERLDGSQVDVEMMRHSEPTTAGHFEGDDTTAVSLPYVGGELAMVVAKPDDGEDFTSWEDGFDRQSFDDVVEGLEDKKGFVDLPKFEDEGDYDLIPPLQALGMSDAFGGAADFSRMADLEEAMEDLYISGIFHQTFIDVDEEGTEAAAATGAVVGAQSAPVSEFEVRFDRPFYYAIYDHGTDSILFMGRMVDPS